MYVACLPSYLMLLVLTRFIVSSSHQDQPRLDPSSRSTNVHFLETYRNSGSSSRCESRFKWYQQRYENDLCHPSLWTWNGNRTQTGSDATEIGQR